MQLKVYEITWGETQTATGTIAGNVVSYNIAFSDQGPVGPVGPQGIQGAQGLPGDFVVNFRVVSAPETLVSKAKIAANTTSGAFTLTLPAAPANGDVIDFYDFAETFDTNPLTLNRNGRRIEGQEDNLICNVKGAYFSMVYSGSARGWQVLPSFGTSGGGGEGTLTTQGDTLYRGVDANQRLPIGSPGQILKVNSGGNAPEWGEAPATGVTSVALSSSDLTVTGSPVTSSGTITANLANSGVAAGTYSKVTVDAKGRVTTGATAGIADVTGLQTALDAKQASGSYATLVGGKVPSDQLPSFVDDVVEHQNLSDFPPQGESGKIYVAIDTRKTYRWSGSAYVEISPSEVTSVNNQTGAVTVAVPAASNTAPSALGAADAGTSANFARADHVHAMPSPSDVGAAPATGISPTAITGTAVVNSDARLSDSRTPLSHSSTHHAGGTDAIAPNNISAQWAEVVSSQQLLGNTTLSAGRNRRITITTFGSLTITLPTTSENGDILTLVAGNLAGGTVTVQALTILATMTSGQSYTFISSGSGAWTLRNVNTHTHAAADITSGTLAIARIPTGTSGTTVAIGNHTHTPSEVGLGNVSNTAQVTSVSGTAPIVSSGGTTPVISVTTGSTANTVCAGDDARLSDARSPLSHTHGNITNGGLVGTTSGLPLKTGTGGIVEAGAFGTSAGQFAEGNHAHGNLTSSGTIGSTAGLPVITTTAGAVTTLALGSANQVLKVNSGGTAVEFGAGFDAASPPAIGSTTPAAGTFTNLVANTELTLPSSAPVSPSAGDVYRNADQIRYRDSTGTTERILLNNLDNLSNLGNTATARTNIGLGSADAVTFGSLQNTPIGSTTRNTGAFTTLNATNGTITASAPVLTLSQTWNNAAVTFTGLDYTITDTNSNSGSRLWDFKVGTTSVFAGRKTLGNPLSEIVAIQGPSRGFVFGTFGATAPVSDAFFSLRWQFNIAGLARDAMFAWGTDVYALNYDLAIQRDAADTLAQRRSTNAQTFRLYSTFSSTTNFERLNLIAQTGGNFIIGTEKGSGGGLARALEFRTDNTARLTIGSGGGFTLADAQDIAVGTTTGTKIGTGTTQKIGFFNATPVVQPAAVADATDAATVITQLNALLSRLRTIGIIAT